MLDLKQALRSCIPTQSPLLYRAARRYMDLYKGENDSNMETNGELRLIRHLLPYVKTVFDVGANLGEWAKSALAINPSVTLHCFEPSLQTYRRLISSRFPQNVACHNFGLSSHPGEAALFVFEEGGGMNSLYLRDGLQDGWGIAAQRDQERVHLDTIDAFCRRSQIGEIDFIKIDAEGHELEICKGMKDLLASASVKAVQFEYGGCNIDARVLLKDIFQWFGSYDYDFYKIYPTSLRRIERYDQRLETFQYQNWLLISRHYRAPWLDEVIG